jgi:hypothetical protein
VFESVMCDQYTPIPFTSSCYRYNQRLKESRGFQSLRTRRYHRRMAWSVFVIAVGLMGTFLVERREEHPSTQYKVQVDSSVLLLQENTRVVRLSFQTALQSG